MQVSARDQATLSRAAVILEKIAKSQPQHVVQDPAAAANIFRHRLSGLKREEFHVAFLSNTNYLIAAERMFLGTLSQCAVYPREIVRRALDLNAAAIVLAHNHPSGVLEPSEADKRLTSALRDACYMVDVRVLDHIIVAGGATLSFASKGLL